MWGVAGGGGGQAGKCRLDWRGCALQGDRRSQGWAQGSATLERKVFLEGEPV